MHDFPFKRNQLQSLKTFLNKVFPIILNLQTLFQIRFYSLTVNLNLYFYINIIFIHFSRVFNLPVDNGIRIFIIRFHARMSFEINRITVRNFTNEKKHLLKDSKVYKRKSNE